MKPGSKPLHNAVLRPSRALYSLSHVQRTALSSTLRSEQDNKPLGSGKSKSNGSIQSNADRDLLFSVLNASTTKRDAKAYLSRFNTSEKAGAVLHPSGTPLYLALIMIRASESLDEATVSGVGRTVSQLARLGLRSVIVLDDEPGTAGDSSLRNARTTSIEADRYVTALLSVTDTKARRLGDIMGISRDDSQTDSCVPARGTVKVLHSGILLDTLRHGTTPIIPGIAYLTNNQRAIRVSPDEILSALTRTLVGLPASAEEWERSGEVEDGTGSTIQACQVEKIIVLDPLGGLPSATRPDKSHIFVNLEQEYSEIMEELKPQRHVPGQVISNADLSTSQVPPSVFGSSKPLSNIAETELLEETARALSEASSSQVGRSDFANDRRQKNLALIQKCLSFLPSSSSALLTTPVEAATFPPSEQTSPDLGVATRRPRNPLIFNLLTDKPIISSSLPVARVGNTPDPRKGGMRVPPASFFKRGMAITMIPDPRVRPWKPPAADGRFMSLEDPRIDFGRLLNLIEDSFSRRLDVEDYVKRIRNKMAGIIVAGEYEGGALLTWELPPGVPDDGSEASSRRMVPYLDKFAVLKRSQGAGGVADVVFSAMVRTCFPNGVCWRSRKNNPVNKWYFERSVGSWKLPDAEWTMFWTTPGLFEDKERFLDYESVCRGVQPSWADKKHILD